MARRHYLIGYDISDNRSRRRALRILHALSLSYQDSVFELPLSSIELNHLLEQLLPLLDGQDRLYAICLNSMSSCWQLGCGAMSPTGPLLLIN
ncbi:CRISPR-associated endonuclease Cas2 [Marinobacterium aestuarii]|uniref:CRISPR-associated endoribonuclease Cas2 n=1 Tax=Marinobacterium aestuarii TaxID=1821621 RepID=A0A1A9EWD6_9GAMM|nr:CRISPR-associated endonuclease Cas2 [Marinobacterium aestuarii]ANG62226.1 CRISPR-associated endonuclease Cas2 [Marinobacterium aestuarii]